ncbi:MAG TPA: hypothetical protein VKV40_20110 [Ktedonobacteraceae bacterium]|nr:hypothetical protein [Ktedonobacteraceae bacterium]
MKYWIMKLNWCIGETNPLIKTRGPFDTREKAMALAAEMDESERKFEEMLRIEFTALRNGQSQFRIPDSASTQNSGHYPFAVSPGKICHGDWNDGHERQIFRRNHIRFSGQRYASEITEAANLPGDAALRN